MHDKIQDSLDGKGIPVDNKSIITSLTHEPQYPIPISMSKYKEQ